MSDTTYLNGYKIYPFKNRDHFLKFLRNEDKNNILVALNAEKLVKNDDDLKKIVNQNIGYPDGIGPVLALKRKDYDTQKIPGAEFWLDIVEEFYQDKTFYLVGSKQRVIAKTASKLKKSYPGIEIINYRNGYMNSSEYEELIDDVTEKKPDIVFVAMGSPKQEFVMEEMYIRHQAFYMGLGGSFDIYSGEQERAPETLQNLGLECSYRLFKEPTRAIRQTSLLTFTYKLITNQL
jgi:UDP-N-acetyl-D-mannosaminouronate:lipid I N-acetyl-D-mannosaminouronosyltransferase